MKNIISFAVIVFSFLFLFQGCYTILELPEISYNDYVYTPEPYLPSDPWPNPVPDPQPPNYPPINDPIIILQPVVPVSNPSPQEHRSEDIQKIRDGGNGRGNSGRNTSFNNSTLTRTEISSSTSNNLSDINKTRGSSSSTESENRRK